MKETLAILVFIFAPYAANAAGRWPCQGAEACGPVGVPGHQPELPFVNIQCQRGLAATFQEFFLPDGRHMGAGHLLWLNYGQGVQTAVISTGYTPAGTRVLMYSDAFCKRELREISRYRWNYVSKCEGMTSSIVCDRYN